MQIQLFGYSNVTWQTRTWQTRTWQTRTWQAIAWRTRTWRTIAYLTATCLTATCLTVTCLLLTVASVPLQAGARDVFATTQKSAIKYRKLAAKASWQQTVTFEAADFIEELPDNRLLVGSVASGSRLGIPRHGPLFLFDKSSGKELWQANRPSLPNGEYTLFATSPFIVLGGLEHYLNVVALDPKRGKQKWSLKLPKESLVEVEGEELFVLSKSDSKLAQYDLLTGKLRWSVKTQVTNLSKDRNPRLLLSNEQIYVIGLGIQCYERKSGKLAIHPLLTIRQSCLSMTICACGPKETRWSSMKNRANYFGSRTSARRA